MTEEEWLVGEDARRMLEFLKDRASPRKLRLLACGICRLHWRLLIDQRSRDAVEIAERYADGLGAEGMVQTAFRVACQVSLEVRRAPDTWPETTLRFRRQRNPEMVIQAACIAAFAAGSGAGTIQPYLRNAGKDTLQGGSSAGLLRCLFGYRRIPIDQRWFSPLVLSISQIVYDERRWAELRILADALEDAGCTETDLLGHLRSPGPHVRGCWALDLILGLS